MHVFAKILKMLLLVAYQTVPQREMEKFSSGHRQEQGKQSYAAALKQPVETHNSNLREIKHMLSIICTWLKD